MTITLPPPFVPGHATLVLFAPLCDICKHRLFDSSETPATFDANIRNSPAMGWAYFCTPHFMKYEGKTGIGRGQALIASSQFDTDTLERIRLMNKEN